MDMITALAVSIGGLALVATYAFLGPLGGAGLHLWAVFIGWASFYGCGGKAAGLQASLVANIWGAFLALVALIVVTQVPLGNTLGVPLWAGIVVGASVVVLVLGAKVPALAAIPSSVYGYASVAALFLLTKEAGANLLSPSVANPFVAIVVSMAIGHVFGFVSQQIAGAIAKS